MSRIVPLGELTQLEPGEIIPSIKCQIQTIGKVFKGSNKHGEFSVQKLGIRDATGEATLKVWDQPEFTKDWQNVFILAESTIGKGGKLTGLIVVDDEYQNKVERQIHLKFGATIEQATDLAPEPAAPATPAAPAPRAAAPVAAVRPAPVKPLAAGGSVSQALPIKALEAQKDGVAEAKKKLGQMANAMILSYDCALFIADQVQARNENVVIPLFSPDILEKIAVSMCIELTRSGLIMGLPTGPLPTKKPALPPSQMDEPPEDWQPE